MVHVGRRAYFDEMLARLAARVLLVVGEPLAATSSLSPCCVLRLVERGNVAGPAEAILVSGVAAELAASLRVLGEGGARCTCD